jgi:hypothetical protein
MDYRVLFEKGQTFDEFLAAAEKNADLWQSIARRSEAPEEFVRRIEATGGPWHVLIMSEDWCGDALNSVPPIAKLLESAVNTSVRVIGRDANPEVMDAHLTGKGRSIPVVMLLDGDFRERAWWGPRPTELQAWVMGPGKAMKLEYLIVEVRRWYGKDRAITTLTEFVDMVERAAKNPHGGTAGQYTPTVAEPIAL